MSFLYGAMVLRWVKTLTLKTMVVANWAALKKPIQMIQDVATVVKWTNA
jgi:hypothetical protein